MNYKLLKELGKQAETECGFDTNKFAELIVQECVNKITAEQDIADQNWSCKNGKHIAWEMLDHFGIDTQTF